MSEKIKVNLLTNYVGDTQYSMLSYAAQLEESLRLYFADSCQTAVFTPMETGFNRIMGRNRIVRKMDTYWNRFLKHPLIARTISGGINHITDHNNSYLIRYLDPRRTVVTCHDLIYFRIPDKEGVKKSWLSLQHIIRKYTVSGLRKAAKIIADSENTKKDIIELFSMSSDRIKVVHPGIRSCFYKIKDRDILSRERKRLHFDWDKTILHVGENLYYKNIEAVLYTLKILHEEGGKEIHFVKVGKDFTPEQKDLIQNLKIENYVHYLGNLGDEDLNLAYNLSDVLVSPSLYEGFGWPPLESMACGTPVVCSDKGSLKEIVGDASLIVEPCNYEEIAEAVSFLFSNTEARQDKILQGFENIKRFDWKKTAEAFFQVYREIWERVKNG
ncbi:MAG: glycosyltransferase family 1 protein [Nitrospirota bacterium]